jgi:hypothetical protein
MEIHKLIATNNSVSPPVDNPLSNLNTRFIIFASIEKNQDIAEHGRKTSKRIQ